MEDITKTGPVGLKGVNTGNSFDEKYVNSPLHLAAELANRKHANAAAGMFTPSLSTNVGLKAAEVGYGDSTFDKNAITLNDLNNLNEVRALSQNWFELIAAGIGKGVVTAGTTFLDGIAGTFFGLAYLTLEAIQGNVDSASDAMYKFINNPFSRIMLAITLEAENWMPNYYSEYEQLAPWYKLIFTSNFLGDKFIKNLGFTIGAAYSSKALAGIAGKALNLQEVRNAFKGAVTTASGKVLNSSDDIYKAYMKGDAFMDGIKLTEDLAKSAKYLKNAEWGLKIGGATMSAMGEGRIEAISNTEDYDKVENQNLDEVYRRRKEQLEEELYTEHPEYFDARIVNEDGTYRIQKTLTSKGQEELNKMHKELDTLYQNAKAKIQKDKAAIANSIFALNVPLLAASDIWQFGRFITGGYTTGSLKKGLVRAGKAAEGSTKTPLELDKAAIRWLYARAASSPFVEAQEEMSQASIAEGSMKWKASELNNEFGSFFGGKIDAEAEAEALDWMTSIMHGFANTYSDIDKWEEGFIGFLTGILGIPSFKIKTNELGKKRLSVSMGGEMWQGFKDVAKMKKDGREIVDYINNRINNDETFLNYYLGLIRHNLYLHTMDGALEDGDAFTYKNAEHAQMVSDAIMFDEAGRLLDLYDIIEQGANITIDDVKTIRDNTVDKATGKSIFEGKTDELVLEHVKKQAQDMKDTVDKYAKIANDLKVLYGDDLSKDVMQELTWGLTQVDNWEERLKGITGDLRTALQEKALILKDRFGIDLDTTLNNFEDFVNAADDEGLINKIVETINDKNLTIQEGRDKIESLIKLKQLEEKSNNLALGRKILELRRKFKESRKRLKKQRENALKLIEKALSEKERLLTLESDEAKDSEKLYNEYYNNTLQEIQQYIEDVRKELLDESLFKGKRGQALRKSLLNNLELSELLFEQIKLEVQLRTQQSREDISAAFAPVLDAIDLTLSDALNLLNQEVVVDRRYNRGYDPNSREVSIGNASDDSFQIVSEAEREERHRWKEKNYNLLFLIMDLKDTLEHDEDYLLVNPLDSKMLLEKLIDFAKILAVRSSFLNTYNTLAKNPNLLLSEVQKKLEQAIERETQKHVDAVIEKLKQATDVISFRTIIKDIEPALLEKAIEQIKESEDKELKDLLDIIANWEGIEDARAIILGVGEVEGILPNTAVTEEKAKNLQEAHNIINEILDNAKSVKEINDSFADAIEELKSDNETKEVGIIIEEVLDKYVDLSKSRRTNRRDKKEEKKVKRRKNKEDKDNESEEEENQEEGLMPEERPRKKGSGRPRIISTTPTEEESEDEDDTDEDENEEYNDETPSIDEEETEDTSEEEEEDDKEDEDTDEDDLSEIVKKLERLSVEDLNDFIAYPIADKIGLDKELEEEDKAALVEIARDIKLKKMSPPAHKGSNGTNSENNKENKNNGNKPFYRSWVVTGYEITPLKDRELRRATPTNNTTANALRELGAFDYVDKGYLGDLFNKDNDVVIHYITAPDKPGFENVILLAIEVKDGVKAINPITTSNGKRYQVVGSLGYNSKSKVAERNYYRVKEAVFVERKNLPKGNYVVSEKFSNRISHFYSGRMVKSIDDKPVEYRSLQDAANGEPIYLGIYYDNVQGKVDAPLLDPETTEIVPLNANNSNPREGSIWVLTKEADGRYYAKGVKIRRFSREEYDIEEHLNAPIMKDIRKYVEIIADSSKKDSERGSAKYWLSTLLYFTDAASGTEYKIVFKDDIVSIIDSNGNNIANDIGKGLDKDEKADALLDAILDLNLRFQVSKRQLESLSETDDLLASDILITDLAMLHNVNASFDMPLLDPLSGEEIRNPVTDGAKTGHTGRKGVNNSIASTTIIVGEDRYSIFDDGTVYKNNRLIKDENLIDEILLRNQIKNGEIEPLEGTTNLYLGVYSDGEEFGIKNGKVIRGKELKELKQKAKKKKDKDKLEKTRETKGRRRIIDKEEDSEDSESIDNYENLDDNDLFNIAQEGGLINQETEEDESEEDENYESNTEDDLDDDDLFALALEGGLIYLNNENDSDTEDDDNNDEGPAFVEGTPNDDKTAEDLEEETYQTYLIANRNAIAEQSVSFGEFFMYLKNKDLLDLKLNSPKDFDAELTQFKCDNVPL